MSPVPAKWRPDVGNTAISSSGAAGILNWCMASCYLFTSRITCGIPAVRRSSRCDESMKNGLLFVSRLWKTGQSLSVVIAIDALFLRVTTLPASQAHSLSLIDLMLSDHVLKESAKVWCARSWLSTIRYISICGTVTHRTSKRTLTNDTIFEPTSLV